VTVNPSQRKTLWDPITYFVCVLAVRYDRSDEPSFEVAASDAAGPWLDSHSVGGGGE